jgi:hypothetical protein
LNLEELGLARIPRMQSTSCTLQVTDFVRYWKILNANHRFWQQEEEELAEAINLLIIHPHKSILQLAVIPS